MRRLAAILLVGLAVILQVSLLPALRPFGVVPNLALVVVVLVSMQMVTSEAVIAAAVSGLVLDLDSGSNFGLWTGVMVLSVLAVAMVQRAGIELDRAFVAPVLVSAGTLVISVVIWVSLIPSVSSLPIGNLGGRLAIELVINLVLTMVMRPVVRMLIGGGGPQIEPGG